MRIWRPPRGSVRQVPQIGHGRLVGTVSVPARGVIPPVALAMREALMSRSGPPRRQAMSSRVAVDGGGGYVLLFGLGAAALVIALAIDLFVAVVSPMSGTLHDDEA